MKKKIRLKAYSYDHRILDTAVKEIINTVLSTGAKISGPVPLPTKIERFSVLRSPHVDKRSLEQFEIRTHKRLVDILEPTSKTMEALRNLNIPSGVEVKIKV